MVKERQISSLAPMDPEEGYAGNPRRELLDVVGQINQAGRIQHKSNRNAGIVASQSKHSIPTYPHMDYSSPQAGTLTYSQRKAAQRNIQKRSSLAPIEG